MNKLFFLISGTVLFCILWFFSCNSNASLESKPWGYPRLDLPKNYGYKTFENKTCPFTFQYPDFGMITRDQQDSCWTDISFPVFDAKWHISHHDITQKKDRQSHYEDFRKLVFKHVKKASTIADYPFETSQGKGIRYELYGNVGAPVEIFFYNDKHTMTADFYLNTAIKNDSLDPVIQLMKVEMDKMVQSFKWK